MQTHHGRALRVGTQRPDDQNRAVKSRLRASASAGGRYQEWINSCVGAKLARACAHAGPGHAYMQLRPYGSSALEKLAREARSSTKEPTVRRVRSGRKEPW